MTGNAQAWRIVGEVLAAVLALAAVLTLATLMVLGVLLP